MKTTADGQVSVRQIAKTFASGKSAEKVVYSTLSECDLPCGKVNNLCYSSIVTHLFTRGLSDRMYYDVIVCPSKLY